MGKSDFKRVVNEACPAAFQLVGLEEICFPVVIEDSIVRLRQIGAAPARGSGFMTDGPRSLDDIVESVFREALCAMKRTRCYIAVFDKSSYVTVAKQPEQGKRDTSQKDVVSRRQIEVLLARLTAVSVLEPGCYGHTSFTQQEWHHLINDRESRQVVISLICHRAAVTLPVRMAELQIPTDHFMVLDFESLLGDSVLTTEKGTPTQSVITPKTITTVPGMVTGSSFANDIGEYDVAALFYLYHPFVRDVLQTTTCDDDQQPCVLLRSIDTDMLPITMLNGAGQPNVRVETTLTKPKRRVLFNPQPVREWLTQLATVSDSMDPRTAVDEFVRMYIISGTDFVRQCPGLSNYRAMASYVDAAAKPRHILPENIIGPTAVKAVYQASKSAAGKRLIYDLTQSIKRSDWCLNYWKHTVVESTKLYASPLGRGFSCVGDKLVYTEDLLYGNVPPVVTPLDNSSNPTKRPRHC